MGKPTSFKNFISVDTRPGEDELLKYRAQKRKRTDIEEAETTDEALSIQQRLARSRAMKKKKAIIAMGRRRAMRKMAPKDKLVKRARRAARNMIVKKLTKGIPKGELNFARRQEIERRVDKMKPRIDRLAKKMFPQIRKKEVARKKG